MAPYEDGTPYNEADTRAKLIDPALKAAGWHEDHIRREHYYDQNKQLTDGRVYLTGETARRRKPRWVDYVFHYHGQIVGLLEAKRESEPAVTGLDQARRYAEALTVPFAYSSNGHGFAEWDAYVAKILDPCDPFPGPDDLWSRWELNAGIPAAGLVATAADARRHPLLHPPCSERITGKPLRYYQEVAITATIERMLRGQQRILLALATGTGKTFIAFQAVWKLRRSGWLKRPVLFLSDRVALRNQAYNAFGPFAADRADPRGVIEGGSWNANRELHFALYQALDAGEDQPLFERIPADYFGLVVVDECHRSGFGKWNRILRHFDSAVHLGMTATPKRGESVDTYAYFCREERELPVDPQDPAAGTWRPPAYSYSLGRGIDDGFLATYKVYKIRTNVDKDGFDLEDAQVHGAEIRVPEGTTPRERYQTSQFEREIRLPDRTAAIVDHLVGLLRSFDPMQKTIVFCVDVDHARAVATLLQAAFSDLGHPDYAVPIVAEDPEAMARLERFSDSDRPTPVVATTAELLTTGIDVPACKNIVLIKPISSQILFKQIIGRGSRIDPATGKEWFRIVDYVNASRLLDSWDRPPSEELAVLPVRGTSGIDVRVVDTESGLALATARVTVRIAPNVQAGPKVVGAEGVARFAELPAGAVPVEVSANGYVSRTVTVETSDGATAELVVELQLKQQPAEQIRVRGLEVTIADEVSFYIEATGERLDLPGYRAYAAERIRAEHDTVELLTAAWVDRHEREALLVRLEDASVQLDVLRDVLGLMDVDDLDLMAHVAFGATPLRRAERAEAVRTVHGTWLAGFERARGEVVDALLTQYVRGGIGEISSGEVFRIEPFRDWGQATGIAARFGGSARLGELLRELQRRIYEVE